MDIVIARKDYPVICINIYNIGNERIGTGKFPHILYAQGTIIGSRGGMPKHAQIGVIAQRIMDVEYMV